jgi:phenylpyruvate tautomerase PptA (4-oxalocrotonate tautomerase family)
MPVITYNTVEGALSDEQKEQLTQALTEAVGKVVGD